MKRLIYLFSKIKFFVSLLLIGFGLPAVAQDSCPAVDCDCGSLPTKQLKSVCFVTEIQLKKACDENEGKPTSYCTISGLKGSPLPLSIELQEITYAQKDQISGLNKQVAALYWSLRTDNDSADEAITSSKFGQAQEILRTMDSNIDNLFNIQRRVTESWVMMDQTRRAKKAWKDYLKDSKDAAEKMNKSGLALLDGRASEEPDVQRAYVILGQEFLSMSGRMYEQIGYGYSQIDKLSDAAKSLKIASEISKTIYELKATEKAKPAHVEFYRNQTAARLHRASVYWITAKKEKEAQAELQASTKFFDSNAQFNELLKKEEEKAAQEEKEKQSDEKDPNEKKRRFGFF